MHSYTSRANAFGSHLLLLVIATTILGSFVGYFQQSTKTPNIKLSSLETSNLRKLHRENCDQAFVRFDLDADFRSIWNWNTHKLFIYIVAVYETKDFERNEVVIWDRIINKKSETKIKARDEFNKYSLKDYGHGLRGTEVKFEVRYNIMPWMGALIYGQGGEKGISMAKAYSGN